MPVMSVMPPEWIIYKNEVRLGQAKTWHKALANLVRQEFLTELGKVFIFHGIVIIEGGYRIIKER